MRHELVLERRIATVCRSEIVAAFTYALDLTEGQPQGHSIRACYIASELAREIGLPEQDRAAVYYATLLKDLGCSSNAARIHELYRADDLSFKANWKAVAPGLGATLKFVFAHTARGAPLKARVNAIAHILKNGDAIAQEMIETRCTRGAHIARELRFGEGVAQGIYHLDEHWDGSGRPGRLAGGAIPLASRFALIAQIADVFHRAAGPMSACTEVALRSGSWLDPELCSAFARIAARPRFWARLESPALETQVMAMAPDVEDEVDDDYLDAITAAFGKVVDAKSPYTAGHSARVADYSEQLGHRLGVLPTRLRRLKRAATLHDVGKLGVSSAILEKPGKLDADEWVVMRSHASHTQAILGRIGALADMAPIAAAHHERLDGKGYPLGLGEQVISRETRIITLCDFYDALTAERPYRAAMPIPQALAVMEGEVGKAIDGDGFEALRELVS
ncbi:HD-GYP domain-containing protein [Croceibacterium aestuarii]|uniref:HD-GYP domain-containing protein n=1 Tax=Croceibacterium aestuarii TaxID=3064139 RepID=UPI00272EC7DC|nr:HD domain-containing phosphohydrolase [Croceibacterium sp. D39]